jgi:hypothetical protein
MLMPPASVCHAQVRGVEKAHARLGREANKAADDMRTRRMEALKARAPAAAQQHLKQLMRAHHCHSRSVKAQPTALGMRVHHGCWAWR